VTFAGANWEKPSAGWYSAGSPTRLTVQTDGLYVVTWSVFCQVGNGVGLRRAYLTKGGSATDPTCEDRHEAGAQAITLNGSVQLELHANDYLEIKFWHSDGSTLKIGSATGYKNRLEASKLSDLT